MRKFDTKVQHLKYKVLREVARLAWADELREKAFDIPEKIACGREPTMRCCVYKERAILSKRVKLAVGGDKNNPNVIEVIDIACDECPMGSYEVSGACRGCLAHRCEDVCHFGAISFDKNHVAHIDKAKCVECGACAKVCPYSAITNNKRPCENACKVKAITTKETKEAVIDNSTCIACGNCVYQCPFGAISEKSYILDVIKFIKESGENKKYRVYAVIAPAIATQFTYARLGQVISGIKALGFYKTAEAALGADIVAEEEAAELCEKGFLISSCCPAFVSYVKNQFPSLAPNISGALSPMAAIAKRIKEADPESKVVFIGPCTAKKMEFEKEEVHKYIDSVLTFEELQALFDSCGLDIGSMEDSETDGASYYGRIFARCGGLAEAVKRSAEERGYGFDIKAVSCDGIEQCRVALVKAKAGKLEANFIEGMACIGGCIGGAGCLTHGAADKSRDDIEKYGRDGKESIEESLRTLRGEV